MSKVVKGVKKVFKKVTRVVKKVAPIALAVGALVFTGGAALGAGFAAGGWGKAAAALTSKFGLSGGLASTIGGAVTQAGYGALTGGVLAELGGGSFSEGARRGAAVGAVTGGTMGALGMNTDPLAGIGEKADAATQTAAQEAASAGVDYSLEHGLAKAGSNVTGNALDATQSTQGGGLLSRITKEGGWLERNQELAGGVIKGLGQGLAASGEETRSDVLRTQYGLERENYDGTDPRSLYRGLSQAATVDSPSPAQRFNSGVQGGYQYRYNQQQGRIERVPA